ncbi:MAG: hypothetical protein ACK5EU_18735 [Pseudanabaena sp.]|jgi:hypothetical protein|nr:hypothetical protein [Pseudanabaena sp. M53BS1SP1A06MG]MCA6582826.1 hypothetical protein [Pseudanabaena sp. M34BS1SP1A06MG]MCA6585769.1 hypothetical protein [Pseudanabaena sp. M051S1SP1A06QC]MCA6593527.1 hypothetical protein [Pseudanabaena sp. M38BS1SP1A06MG]MCA6597755.1 hypothetical protein [Pseudanabaena sp. M046S1SP1A06QC]MCA6602419.1 hypothetical protein [Pseudanabaena sp. M57BS1SP1A06MG]MCA6604029.1 hypothetical protein [Pseudanabaena sp. M007S1SP1A06QC]MCA6612107.1 hypothetical prot
MTNTTQMRTYQGTQNTKQSHYLQCLQPLPSTWVTLLEPIASSSYDEALLMCQYPDGQWAAWIPDLGEIKLHSGQFCRMS